MLKISLMFNAHLENTPSIKMMLSTYKNCKNLFMDTTHGYQFDIHGYNTCEQICLQFFLAFIKENTPLLDI